MSSENRIRLQVMGISSNPIQTGAFVLVLAQTDGPYRIPVVIGAAEAQSIAVQLERIVTKRPLTHDLFCSLSHAYGLELKEVYIYKFEEGIFSAELTFSDGDKDVKLDARTSDAIAIALRMDAPIYTTEEILLQTGGIVKEGKIMDRSDMTTDSGDSTDEDLESMPIEMLEKTLDKLIEEENYEEAARYSEIIKRRKNEKH